MNDALQAEPVEPVLNTTDFNDELADEALDRDKDTRLSGMVCVCGRFG